jgi:predicted cation transporter
VDLLGLGLLLMLVCLCLKMQHYYANHTEDNSNMYHLLMQLRALVVIALYSIHFLKTAACMVTAQQTSNT